MTVDSLLFSRKFSRGEGGGGGIQCYANFSIVSDKILRGAKSLREKGKMLQRGIPTAPSPLSQLHGRKSNRWLVSFNVWLLKMCPTNPTWLAKIFLLI